MRQNAILFFVSVLLTVPTAAFAQDESDLQKLIREVEELRKTAEKEFELRNEDRKDYQRALEELRQELAKVQEQAVGLRIKLASNETELQLLKRRNESLEKQNQTFEKLLAAPEKREPRPVVEAPAPERPPLDVFGKITNVADTGLFVISIGSEDGMKQGYVLDVYRKAETPIHLGTLTLVRAYGKQAIGSFKALGQERPEVGDEVVARIVAK